MIWRRLVVPSESTLADLHYAIQIAFAWTGSRIARRLLRADLVGDDCRRDVGESVKD